MKDYQVMPELSPDEYEALKADIAENGVLVPIEVDEYGNILDGYNRKQICDELGIECPEIKCVGLDEDGKDEMAYKLNLTRRHLTHNQKIDIAKSMAERHPDWTIIRISKLVGVDQAELSLQLQGILRLQKTTGEDGRNRPANEAQAQEQREAIREMITENPDMNNHQIAQAIGASDHTVGAQRRKMVSVFNGMPLDSKPSSRDDQALRDPDIQRRLAENDGMNVAGAIREQKRDELVERLESIETKEAKAIEGVYDVVVIDPPWALQKIERDARPNQAGLDYPVMSIDEIKQLKIPAADDCHVFLWTTQKFLHEAFHVMEAWNVKPIWTFVWVKNNGVKPYGLPTSTVEFILYGHIGAPEFTNEKAFRSDIMADATGHSKKPEAFYDMVRNHTAGRRLDMFNRRSIEGFDAWGKEANNG